MVAILDLEVSPEYLFLEKYSTWKTVIIALFCSRRWPLCTGLGYQMYLTFKVFIFVKVVTKQIIGVYNKFENTTKLTILLTFSNS